MALLFAVGIAIGFAKKLDGSTALAAVVGYLVFKNVLATFTDKNLPKVATAVDGKVVMVSAPVDAKVLGGVVMGIVVALLYQKFYRTKLPDWQVLRRPPARPDPVRLRGSADRHRLRLHLAGPRHGSAQLR